MRRMNLEEVLELMEQKTTNYGFRGATKRDLELIKSGEYLDASLDLWDSRDCNYDENADKMNGTSAICITEYMDFDELKKAYEYAKGYADNHHGTGVVLLISGDYSDYGDDEDEVILRSEFEEGAQVIAFVEL